MKKTIIMCDIEKPKREENPKMMCVSACVKFTVIFFKYT